MSGGGGRGGEAVAADHLNCKLESLHKRCKFAIEVDGQRSISHCERMIILLEEKETREMEGGSRDDN